MLNQKNTTMAFELPELPFELDALEPYISKKTLEFHYGKHHQAYVNNVNKLIKDTSFEYSSLEDIIKKSDGGIYNNGAQVFNHTFYFEALSRNGGGEPLGYLGEAINKNFGSFEKFKEEFTQAGLTLFGSGWVWLVITPDDTLEIMSMSNAGNPLREDYIPLLTMDVWEHAYYLDTQNARGKYIENFWNIVNWVVVAERY